MSLPSALPSPLVIQVALHPEDFLDLIKLEHVLAGIYIWEYFTTLDVEWNLYRGKKRKGATSTAWIYSLCKLSALAYTIVNLIGLNVTSPTAISCEAWIVSRFAFATLAVMCASALATIRISALWDRNVAVVLACAATALAFAAFWLRQSVLSKNFAIFVPELGCEYIASTNERPLALAILAASVVYLILLTGGLLRRGVFGKPDGWRALYVQGVAWLVLAAGFAIPGVVLLFTNMNGAWNQMLRGPELLILVIGATRLYSTLMCGGGGSFAIFRDDVSTQSSNMKPTQLEAFKFRAPGAHTNSVTFEIAANTLQSTGGGSLGAARDVDSKADLEGGGVGSESPANNSVKDLGRAELGGDADVLYIGREKGGQGIAVASRF